MRWGLDSDDQALTGNRVCMDTYLEAIESYILYCKENSYPTTWVFTTGPVDYHGGRKMDFNAKSSITISGPMCWKINPGYCLTMLIFFAGIIVVSTIRKIGMTMVHSAPMLRYTLII